MGADDGLRAENARLRTLLRQAGIDAAAIGVRHEREMGEAADEVATTLSRSNAETAAATADLSRSRGETEAAQNVVEALILDGWDCRSKLSANETGPRSNA